MELTDQRGSISPFLAGLVVAAFLGAMGSLAVLHHWHRIMTLQLALDRCVGETAQTLARTLTELERFNNGIKAARVAVAAASLIPPALPPLKAALIGVVLGQEAVLASWRAREVLWLARLGCRLGAGDLAPPLPALRGFRPPPDAIGPQAWKWLENPRQTRRIALWHSPRAAAARIRSQNGISWIPDWDRPAAPAVFGAIAD